MQIRIQTVDEELIVRVHGDLTRAAASELLGEIDKELAPAARDVVLDLQDVERVDADALAYLFRIQERARSGARTFRLTGARDSALRLFACTNVAAKLDLAAAEDDARRVSVR
jgi:anti-anti-sigma factor